MHEGYAALNANLNTLAVRIGRSLIESQHSSGYEILAHAYDALGERQRATSTLEDGVAVAPSVWLLWHLLGHHYSDQGRYADALRCYDSALKCERVQFSFVYYNSAIALARAGRFADSLRALDQVSDENFAEKVADLRARVVAAQE